MNIAPALDAPSRNGSIMDCAPKDKVGLDISLESIQNGSFAANPILELRMIWDAVQDGEPVAGGRFGIGTVGPELGQNP